TSPEKSSVVAIAASRQAPARLLRWSNRLLLRGRWGRLIERTLPLDQTERVVGQDQHQQRSHDHQPDLLEAPVGAGRDRSSADSLDQGEQDVAAIEDRQG